jgi:DMSO/TMAO reductase YedYZ molybdopterin-dependent catalytic subunit
MKRTSLSNGAWIGGITSVGLLALLYFADQVFGAPFVPFDFWNWQARIIPRNLLSLAVSGIGFTLAKLVGAPEGVWGKTSEQIGAIVLFVLLCASGGWIAARIKTKAAGKQPPAGVWVGIGLFVLTTALELVLGRSPIILPLMWLAVTLIGWGVLLDAILNGRRLSLITAETDLDRRTSLLKLAGGMLGAALGAWGLGRWLGNGRNNTGADQPLGELIASTPEPPEATVTQSAPEQATPLMVTEVPTGDDGRILPAPGTREELTPDGQFYRVDISPIPISLDGDLWRLVIAGLFEQTPRMTIDDLRAYPAYTQPITLSCISNSVGGSAISTAHWTGLRLSDLVKELGLKSEANYLHIQAADGFYETVAIEDVVNPETLLVYGMNDRSLPDKHGFPLRIYIPNRYGMKQPKWIERIEAVVNDPGGYWTDRGWSKQATANTTSVIDVIAVDEAHDGYIPVGGIAWAGDRDIRQVEVQVDDGPWQSATLRTPSLGHLAWVQWRHEWPSTPKAHTLRVRATDGSGELQTSEKTGTLPDGATGYHTQEIEI